MGFTGFRVAAAGAVLLASLGGAGLWTAPAAFAETAGKEVPAAKGEARASLFDPERHMRVSEVKAGMKGYGLSVFMGTKIDRFEVEVLSVLENFNPKYDVVLITCKGANLEHTGSIAGMSGSPIYLKDEKGRERMIGAFAYGWPLTKDPLAGVQPIEYMLTLSAEAPAKPMAGGATTRPADAGGADAAGAGKADAGKASGRTTAWDASSGGARPAWSWNDAVAQWHRQTRPAATGRNAGPLAGGDAPRLEPLATPLMASGLSPKLLDQLAPAFKAAGLVPLQAGAGGSGVAGEPPARLEPGSVLAVPLLTGDVELTAVGTCTEVLGDRVFGFGHSFNNEGPVSLPMGSGRVNGIVANLMTSFKLGSLTKQRGTITSDQTVGVAGLIGDVPRMVPIEIKLSYTGKNAPQDATYRFQGALHPKFTPLICGAAFAAAMSGTAELPQYNTVDYAIDLEFENGRTVHITDTAVNTNAMELFHATGLALMAASENPFERVMVKRVTGTVKVTPEAREGQILEVNVPRSKYRPGETVKAFVTYKPFRSAEAIMPVEMDLPKDLPQGTYQLVISDANRYFQDEQSTRPFHFTAEKVEDVFDVLKDVMAVRHNAVYVRLIRQPDGVAVGRTALPQLPSSRRQILMGSGRSNTTAFVSSTVKVIPTDRVMVGSAEFQIQIETHTKVESGTGGHGPTSRPAAPGGASKPDDAKPPKAGPGEPPKPKDPKEKEV